MKQFLLLLCLCALTGLHAQDTRTLPVVDGTKTPVASGLSQSVANPAPAGRQIVDTLLAPGLGLPCGESLALYFSDTAQTGYLSGTNPFFDLEKLQIIELDDVTTFDVTAGLALFGVADANVADRTVIMNVYTYATAANPLGDYLGSSDELLVSDLSLDGYTVFPFSTPVTVDGADRFIISVDLTDVYFNAQDSVDYVGNVALLSTEIDCGDGTNAFEIFPTADGNRYNDILTNWGVDLELALGAVVDRQPFVSVRTPLADYGLSASPNPATDDLTVRFAGVTDPTATVSLLAPDGRRVAERTVAAGSGRATFSVAELPAGLYLYRVQTASGSQTARVVVR